MKVDIINKFNDIIFTYSDKNRFGFINEFEFGKLLDEEYTVLVENNLIFDLKINIIKDDGEKIGEVYINISGTNFEKEELYDTWYDADYSMGFIAINIIKDNMYYKIKNFNRVAVITNFKLNDAKNRNKGYGSTTFKLIEEILKKVFKVECLLLYLYPIDLPDNLKLYQDYIDYPNNTEIRSDFFQIDKHKRKEIKKEYTSYIKRIDSFYKKMNMVNEFKNNRIFYKKI